MEYMLLLYERESDWQALSEDEKGAIMREYFALSDSIRQSGHYRAGNPLHPTTAATTVRVREGKTLTTDGPFAETREQLGGYYLIDAKDLDEAIAIAARVPGARTGSVEIRPILRLPPK
ncbi:MAG TPA: YciI family protein [Thermoanaerobaculia bacterium]|jgi:hypothetical protein|nr:YciI family protein [Thermoanaerobaculia bacterium]